MLILGVQQGMPVTFLLRELLEVAAHVLLRRTHSPLD